MVVGHGAGGAGRDGDALGRCRYRRTRAITTSPCCPAAEPVIVLVTSSEPGTRLVGVSEVHLRDVGGRDGRRAALAGDGHGDGGAAPVGGLGDGAHRARRETVDGGGTVAGGTGRDGDGPVAGPSSQDTSDTTSPCCPAAEPVIVLVTSSEPGARLVGVSEVHLGVVGGRDGRRAALAGRRSRRRWRSLPSVVSVTVQTVPGGQAVDGGRRSTGGAGRDGDVLLQPLSKDTCRSPRRPAARPQNR